MLPNNDRLVINSIDNTYRQLSSILRQMTLRDFKPDCIAAVSRGGLVPGVYMSHYFEVPLITLHVDDNHQPKMNIALHEVADSLKDQKKILLVDDICDKGNTLYNIWNTLYRMCPEKETDSGHPHNATVVERNLHTAVLIHNEGEDLFNIDYCGTAINKVEDPSWIVFDWETWWV